jgi:hypothetical protein
MESQLKKTEEVRSSVETYSNSVSATANSEAEEVEH